MAVSIHRDSVVAAASVLSKLYGHAYTPRQFDQQIDRLGLGARSAPPANHHIEVSDALVDLPLRTPRALSSVGKHRRRNSGGFYASTRACKRAERRGQFVAVVPNSR